MKQISTVLLAALLAVSVSACKVENSDVGTVAGAAAGAGIGYAASDNGWGAAAGAGVGALLGKKISEQYDD